MDNDSTQQREQGGFPVDHPMEALKSDHQMVRQLFDRYLTTQDENVKREAGPRILMMLEMHSALEETIFYPRVRQADARLIDECEDQHHHASQMIEQLKGMDEADPQCEQMFRQLAESVLQHIEIEEHQLFPKVEQANLDLSSIGAEMQAFESSMVAGQANSIKQPGLRP
jgi:hemerythrin superfamily protein